MELAQKLTTEQKHILFEQGYIIIKNVIPQGLINTALAQLNAGKISIDIDGDRKEKTEKQIQLLKEGHDNNLKEIKNKTLIPSHFSQCEELTDLINKSSLSPILREVMGPFDPPSAAQTAIQPIMKPSNEVKPSGYHDKDIPYYGSIMHLDGAMSIKVPQEKQEGEPEEIYKKFIASGPKGKLGRVSDVIGDNQVPMFQDPEMTLGLGSFTAFAIVCLSDQTLKGRGQTAVLPKAHHAVEKFFRWQRETNNQVGIEGPGWPRLNYDAPNRCGMVLLPEEITNQFINERSKTSPDGKRWPKPTQVLMDVGDACIMLYQMPHSRTRNELGIEPRINVFFRLRHKKRQPKKITNGVTDNPDRGPMGSWLEFEDGVDNPWERSKYAMCNMWHEWDGMQQIVAEQEGPVSLK